MERFLSQCAEYIYKKHTDELREICIVFPNRRSGVFFTAYLQKYLQGAVIGPNIITVNEFISGFSSFHQGEKLQLIYYLYGIFRKHTQTWETFDEFYFWGEILLNDFNDIDRYLVNANDIFRNVADAKEIETLFDYLTREQKEAIEHFWGSVSAYDKKEFHQKYFNIWEKLSPVYSDYKNLLFEEQISYGGMSDRFVTELLKENKLEFPFKKYYVIGLNALNSCEKEFFKYLQKAGKAEFLWDFDHFYLNDIKNEAGRFMRENLAFFPPPEDFLLGTDSFDKKKNIKLVAVSSVYGQPQELPVFFAETKSDFKAEFDNTAVVLADESLLFSALGAIPEQTGTINITMGYPVKNSVVYGFLLLLVNLLKNCKRDNVNKITAYYRYVTDILNHHLLAGIESEKTKSFVQSLKTNNRITVPLDEINFSALHRTIFTLPESTAKYTDYFLTVLGGLYVWIKENDQGNRMLQELVYSIYMAVEKIKQVFEGNYSAEISPAIYFRLFSQYLGQVSVSFEGEPLSGVQMMGILETRCLDFENLIILGLNENKWPRTFTAPSFIPHNIRKGFGLPGIDEQDAMYAYYFYRLIQRSKNLVATYSVVKEGINTGELSRYGFQLLYDSKHAPNLVNLDFSFANDPTEAIQVNSSELIVKDFLSRISEEHPLSPSALNIYLQCSLRFYFRYFMQLPEPEEIKDEIDSPVFGNIFHETIELLYSPFVGTQIHKSDLEAVLKDDILIENEIRKAIAKHYLMIKEPENKPVTLEGKTLLIFRNIKTFLKQLINIDLEITPFKIVSLEKSYKTNFPIHLNGIKTNLWIGGKIDRVDFLNNSLRVLDYKTGKVDSFQFNTVEEIFEKDIKSPKKEILQALYYTNVLSDNFKEVSRFQPVIYSLRKFFEEDHSPEIKHGKEDFSFEAVKEDFQLYLEKLIQEILSPETVFNQTKYPEKCLYCPYNKICRKF